MSVFMRTAFPVMTIVKAVGDCLGIIRIVPGGGPELGSKILGAAGSIGV